MDEKEHKHIYKLASSTSLVLQEPKGTDKARLSNITILYCECGDVIKRKAMIGIWES